MGKLKPCPFCGGKAKISVRQMEYYGQTYYGDKKIRYGAQAICCSCHARGPLSSMTAISDGEGFKVVRNALIRNAANDWNTWDVI